MLTCMFCILTHGTSYRSYKWRKGAGLTLEAYQRLFWVFGFWWRRQTERDERGVDSRQGLAAVTEGGRAISENALARR